MDNHSTKGKGWLVSQLIEKGMSVRKARKAVEAVFGCMARAVRRGEVVEIPGGTIQGQIMEGKPTSASAEVSGRPNRQEPVSNSPTTPGGGGS